VCDTDGDCDNAQVNITVQAVNDPPQALDDAASTLVNVAQAIDVLANDSDVEGQPVRLADFPATTSQGGTLTRLNNGTPDDRSDDQLQYQPAAGFTGLDTFSYTASDGAATDNAQVIVTVQSGPGAPVAVDDNYTTDQGVPLNIGQLEGVLANDLDPKGTGLTANLVTPPTHGTLNLLPDGGFTYTPALDFNGTESFTYQANDGVQTSNVATAEIQVQAANVSPLATDDSYQVDQDQTLNIPPPGVLGNDSDPNDDNLAASLVNPPTHGTLSLKADGSFTYTPAQNFVGQDQFTYKASDNTLNSPPATVRIQVRDTTVPSVNWVLPVETGMVYDVTFETVNLMATASDNKSVARVRFYRWDAMTRDYVEIGVDNKAPFTTTLDAGQLHLAWNQVFARAYDAAGNPSIQQYIWLYRLDVAFVPMTRN
jgi:VCBS repeat-containing protein